MEFGGSQRLACIVCVLTATTSVANAGTDREARQVYSKYTLCAAKHHPKDAEQVVLSNMQNDDVIKKHPALITPDCLDSGDLTLPGDFIRYGLAEALVRRDYSNGLPKDIGLAAPLTHMEVDEADYQPKPGQKLNPQRARELERRKKEALGFRYLSIYGECIARKDSTASLQLVLSVTDSDQERRAFEALRPQLGGCLMQGQTIAFDRAALRGSIAMNLYRLAKAPRIPAATKVQ